MSLGAILPAVGTIIGALGGGGNQGGQTSTNTQTQSGTQNTNQSYTGQATGTTLGQSTGTTDQTTNQTTTGANRQVEDAGMAGLRSGLSRLFAQQFGQAQQPIYGEAEKAGFLGNLNDLTASSTQALQRQLASSGMSASGAAAAGAEDIQRNWLNQATSFFRDLPGKEAEAKQARMNSLLGMASGWLGSGPLSTVSSGQTSGTASGTTTGTTNETTNQTQSGNQTGTTTSTGSSTSTGSTTEQGGGFLNNLFSGVGGLLGSGWSPFGGNTPSNASQLPTKLSNYWRWQPGVNS